MVGMFTSSSTEPLSAACLFELPPSDDSVLLTNKHAIVKKSKAKISKPDHVSAEVQQAISDLQEAIPKLTDIFTIANKIGAGTFSSVYLARLKQQKTQQQDVKESGEFALKHIVPTSHPSRIESELRCLQEIGGKDNVINISACLRVRDHVVIVMPYFQHDKFADYVCHLSVCEVRDYMYNLLLALRRVHALNIIHRDIKPSNFLFNRKLKKYSLVDFGLSHKAPASRKSVTMKKEEAHPPSGGQRTSIRPVSDMKADSPLPSLSPRSRARRTKESTQPPPVFSSPRKRKMATEDIENSLQSPRKRRPTDTSTKTTLTEIGNTPDKCDTTPGCKRLNPITPPTAPDLLGREKSPRRLVLTKRALIAGRSSGVAARALMAGRSSGVSAKPASSAKCQCYGQPSVCTVCMSRSVQRAPRAGTPGFRSPEVLMRWPDQTTAVDIWSAGVIFLSLLTARYPFFKANDDMTALGQLMSIFGTHKMKEAAATYDKNFLANPVLPSLNLRDMCERLCMRVSADTSKPADKFSISAYTLLTGLLDLNPTTRITAEQALKHPFFDHKHDDS